MPAANLARTTEAGAGSVPAGPWGKVYRPRELAALWQLSESSIRKLFADASGVFTLGSNGRRGKRSYQTLRIPESVAARVWRERGGGGRAQ